MELNSSNSHSISSSSTQLCGTIPNGKDHENKLESAVGTGDKDLVTELLASHPELDPKSFIVQAITNDDPKMVELLLSEVLKRKSNSDECDLEYEEMSDLQDLRITWRKNWDLSLHLAQEANLKDLVQILTELGARKIKEELLTAIRDYKTEEIPELYSLYNEHILSLKLATRLSGSKSEQDLMSTLEDALRSELRSGSKVVIFMVDNTQLEWGALLVNAVKYKLQLLLELSVARIGNRSGSYKHSALIQAIKNKQPNLVEYFLGKGFNPDTALVYGALYNMRDVVEYALYYGAKEYDYALIKAATTGSVGMAEFLIRSGAKNIDDALTAAAHHNRIAIISFFMKAESDIYPAYVAALNSDYAEIVEYLESKRAIDIDLALSSAALADLDHALKILISQGADNLNKALVEASGNGALKTIQELISSGADNLNEALLAASLSTSLRATSAMKLLIQFGADDHSEALFNLIRNDNQEIGELLPIVVIPSREFIQEAVDLADQLGHHEISAMLEHAVDEDI